MWMLEVELTGTKVKEQQHERAVLPCIIGTHSKTNSVRYISKPCLWGHSSFSLLSLAWLVLSASPLHPGVDLYWPTCRASGEKPGDSLQCRGALYHCPVHSPSLAIAILQPQGSFWAIISAGLWAGQQGAICSLLWKHKLSPDTQTNASLSSPNSRSFSASRSRAGAVKVSWPLLSLSALLCHFFLLYHCVSSCWWSWPPCSSRHCIRALQHIHPSPSTLRR